MKLLLAVDTPDAHDAHPAAEELIKRLRFAASPQAPHVDIVHVVPPPAYVGYDLGTNFVSPEILQQAREAELAEATDLVDSVARRFAGSPYSCETAVLEGSVAGGLLERAEQTGTDLIAVNRTHHGETSALLAGSVVRSLVSDAPCSLLIAKPPTFWGPSTGKLDVMERGLTTGLRVVLATDHSEYMDRCVDRLLSLGIQGILHLTVVSAYPAGRLRSLGARVPHLSVDLAEAARHSLETKNAALIERLRAGLGAGVRFESLVVAGPVHNVVDAAMRDTEADLLIVGARGHGFVERLTLGSVSYREAVASPHSVLVLRA